MRFLVLAAAGASRRMLLPRDGADAVVLAGEAPLLGGDEEEMMMVARRVDLQTEDYPGSGANGRHDPRNPH